MPEPIKPGEKQPFVKRALQRSTFARLPWNLVLRRKVLYFILTPLAIMALLTVPQLTVDVYHKSPPDIAGLRAVEAFGLGLFMWSLMGLIFVLLTAMLWQIVLDLVQLCGEIRKGIQALPGLWANFSSACGRGYRRIKGIPAAIRAMDREQWAFAIFMTFGFGCLGAIAYLGWPVASHVAAKLPHWLAPSDKLGVFVLDLFASVMIWALAFPILTTVIFSLFPGLRPRRSDKNPK